MRRNEKEITQRQEIDLVIHDCDVIHLALALHNEPYVVPLNFGYDGRWIYIHTAREGRKIDFIETNPRVCFALERRVRVMPHDTRPCKWSCAFESVIGNGVIAELQDLEQKINGLNQIMKHYSPESWAFDSKAVEATRVWRIEIQQVTGKRSNL